MTEVMMTMILIITILLPCLKLIFIMYAFIKLRASSAEQSVYY